LQDFAEYELWTQAEFDAWIAPGRNVGTARHVGSKTSFCITDSRRVVTLPGTPSTSSYEDCGSSVQGLSVGWGDTYGWALPEQWVDLGIAPLADGSYVLRSIADPLNKLYESAQRADLSRESTQANEATRAFTVRRGHIRITR
ncbi:MAG TPA: lysyl oxidase family protein, partial [Solirubrobacteraceae bacterium]|nr:lysyl oxidase family protein [Solirubrobacteraceae bacterium]